MLIGLQNLEKDFGEAVILKGITANVEQGDRIGIVGENGAGKTTLLRMLCGEYQPDAGELTIVHGVTLGYLEQNSKLDPALDVYGEMRKAFQPVLDAMARMQVVEKQLALHPEADGHGELLEEHARLSAVVDAADGYNMDIQIKKVLSGMAFGPETYDKRVAVLSGGEQTRLRLAKLLLQHPDVLILDEPTNHLDFATMEWLENFLKGYSGAVLVVSHDRYFLDAVCNRIWEVENQGLTTYKGRRKQLEKMEITEAPKAGVRELKFRFEFDIAPYNELVTVKNLCIKIGTRTLLEPFSMQVLRGQRLVIAGPNGAGKSTLLQVLDGRRRPSGGMVRLGAGARTSIFEQQQARRAGRVIDAIWDKYPKFTELEVRSHLARFNFRGEDVFKECSQLSGGEMARLRFAEILLERPNLMFLDEPTNHLDIYTRESLTQALMAYEGTLLLVTHDRYLMNSLACPILYLEDGKATMYESYEQLMAKDKEVPAPAEKPQTAAPRPAYGKEQRRRRAELRARLKAVEDEIEQLGAHIVELENEINDPEVLKDHVLLQEKCDDLDDTRFHQNELYEEWEKLMEEQEQDEEA